MNVTLLHTPTSGAVYASLDQDAQMDAFLAPWADGPVVLRYYSAAGVLLDTATHAAWVLNSAVVPRRATVGAITARTFAAGGYASYVVAAVPAGADIMRSPVSLAGPVTALSRASLLTQTGAAGLVVRADPDLPLAADVVHALTFAAADTGVAGVDFALSITNTGTAAESWSIAPPAHVSLSASSGTVAAGATVDLTGQADQAGTYGLTLVCAGATITGASQSVVVTAAPATTLTLSVPATGQATRAVTVTVTPNGPVVGGGSVTLAETAGTLGSTTLTWADGDSAPKTTTLTLAAPGEADVTMTTGTGLTVVGSPAHFTASDFVPAWVAAAAVGEWAQISGTALNGSTANYGGVALRDDAERVELCEALAGGHTTGQWLTDNRVRTLRLDVDTPAWVQRKDPSDPTGWDTTGTTSAYFSDGRPVPRHTYVHTHWLPERSAYVFGGSFSGRDASGAIPRHDLFVPSGDSGGEWVLLSDPAKLNTFPQYHVYLQARRSSTGEWFAWMNDTAYKWNPTTDTWATFATSGSSQTWARGGACHDSTRDRLVVINGAGWFTQGGAGSGTRTFWASWSTGVKTAVAFNASSAWTDFQANAPYFVGTATVYDAAGDCFYVYNGNTGDQDPGAPVVPLTGQTAKVYKVIPNATNTWDMEILPVTGVTPAAEPNTSGVYSKFRFIPRWNVLVLCVSSQSIYYLKVR